MSTLKDLLAQRRAEETGGRPLCYSTNDRTTTLRIETSDGAVWLLPWRNFLFSRLDEDDDQEQLVLTFQGHEVVLHGEYLRNLVKMIENTCLASLCPVPGKYPNATGSYPFIQQAQMRPIAEPTVSCSLPICHYRRDEPT
jgi:hypothetical protein